LLDKQEEERMEALRRSIIEQERQKLLKEHASKLLGYLPKVCYCHCAEYLLIFREYLKMRETWTTYQMISVRLIKSATWTYSQMRGGNNTLRVTSVTLTLYIWSCQISYDMYKNLKRSLQILCLICELLYTRCCYLCLFEYCVGLWCC